MEENKLPVYSKGEAWFNTLSHAAGAVLAGAVLAACLAKAEGAAQVVGALIYGISMLTVYAVSTIYHALPPGKTKHIFRVLDHCVIYLLIAGTYTPILLSGFLPVYPGIGWGLLAMEWGLTAMAVTLLAIDLKKYNALSMVCYIFMGWGIIFFVKQAVQVLTRPGFLWILAGGLAYTFGAVLYGIGSRRKWFHSVFHIFVVLGSALQAVAIYYYVLL